MTRGSYWRIALVVVLGIVVLEYVWVRTEPQRPRGTGGYPFGLKQAACPDPAQLGSVGEMDYAWTVTALDGTELRVEQFRDKVLFVNIWATWCAPCVAEMPSIQALHDTLKDQGVVFLLVSEEDADTVKDFASSRGLTVPVYVSGKLPTVFDSRGIPATFVANRSGKLVWRHFGAASWNTDSCQKLFRSLLQP